MINYHKVWILYGEGFVWTNPNFIDRISMLIEKFREAYDFHNYNRIDKLDLKYLSINLGKFFLK